MAILIIGPAWVGDMVMAQSLFKALRLREPDCPIDVLAPLWSQPLLARMPEVRQKLISPFVHGQFDFTSRRRLARQLKDTPYQQAIVLPNSWKSALVPFLARIPKRTGWLGELRYGLLNDARRLDKKAVPQMAQRFAQLAYLPNTPLQALHEPRLVVSKADKQAIKARFPFTDAPLLVLCPGAEFGPAKQWPAAYYAEVIKAKRLEGWQICLLGSARDQKITREITELAATPVNDLAGQTSLDEALVVLSLADAVISNDSGLMHVAAALDRPVLGLFGPTDPHFTPPLAQSARTLQAPIELACRPCFGRQCRLEHHRCLKELKSQMVLDTLKQMCVT